VQHRDQRFRQRPLAAPARKAQRVREPRQQQRERGERVGGSHGPEEERCQREQERRPIERAANVGIETP
jgi:hypothetical protein